MKQKVALVLSSGGARGTAHIGVIRELLSRGYEITSISGSSMGAIVGGVYASGKLDEYEEWIRDLGKMDMFNLIDFTLSTNGIIKADKVLNAIKKFIPDQNIENLPIQFAAVATDILHKKEIIFTRGSLFEAIRASIAIPLVIRPAKKNDMWLVDGGVLNPVPVNRVARNDGDILIAVNVNAQIPFRKPNKPEKSAGYINQLTKGKLSGFQEKLAQILPQHSKKERMGYFNLMTDTISLMLSQMSRLSLEANPPDVIINISRHVCGNFDFYKAEEVIEIGRNAAQKEIIEFQKKLHNEKNDSNYLRF